ncbi:DUF6241 domain-containing protein [Bacillus sp. FJAT-52991]|uniref:DUF6241 domain-containing protein n=1 Tax=Bacillus kandeliae TaxID=3129297 RepID=A0ABZ2N4R3_9BACI
MESTRKNSKKIGIILLFFILLITLTIYGSMQLIIFFNDREKQATKEQLTKDGINLHQVRNIQETEETNEVTVNSIEQEVLDVMNKMTHQFVIADDKWGAVEMTPERIDQLTEIVSVNDYPNKERILSILEKWKKGNFETVDDDHNVIWNMQDGNIGEAKGVMSEKEQEAFKKNNFTKEEAKNHN